jgi:hypothetical protein
MTGSFLTQPQKAAPYPLLSNIIAPYDPWLMSTTGSLSANQMAAVRVTIPFDGTLHGMTCFVTTGSGNVDLGIFDTAAGTRHKLASSGSIACVAGPGYQTAFDPNLAVKRGDQLDFAIACDNITASFGRSSANSAAQVVLPAGFRPSPLGGVNTLGWKVGASFPLPATILESAFSNSQSTPWVGCFITPTPT